MLEDALKQALHLTDRALQAGQAEVMEVRTPITGELLTKVMTHTPEQLSSAIGDAHQAFLQWRTVPAPVRGELVRRFGNTLRAKKAQLGKLVTLEAGKIVSEAEGEVQEMIDICDFGVGLSRQLYGLDIASERPEHKLSERWHPLGPIGCITAFNFPVAVWAWNAALALVCGDPVVWKPSDLTPLCALACHGLLQETIAEFDEAPEGLSRVILGWKEIGEAMTADRRLPLISATGSTRMGQAVGAAVGGRLGRSLLELGGNNAMILTPSADLDLALRAITFGAVGTAGQRCTTLRRLIVHRSLKDEVVARLQSAYQTLRIGDPRDADTLVGPLIHSHAAEAMADAIKQAKEQGGDVWGGGGATGPGIPKGGAYVHPAIVEIDASAEVVGCETFAPILYVLEYESLEDAIALQNSVDQGLSSAIFTEQFREGERFLSPAGSDCGIANVNLGTSGAEIGGAFGGEKDTGGGRESGSDAWKNYMRRQTQTVNYGSALPLAQGVEFG
ncbi:MAG: aldehyde dehydrogenase family protein [Planctomycetota bacterium]